jgi:hypothetical protein
MEFRAMGIYSSDRNPLPGKLAAALKTNSQKKLTLALTKARRPPNSADKPVTTILTPGKLMEGSMKMFRTVTSLSMILTVTAAVGSIIGIAITGFYPGIIVLLLLTLIPIVSKIYEKRMVENSKVSQVNYYLVLTIINLLTILVALWMTFVILVDRVFGKVL